LTYINLLSIASFEAGFTLPGEGVIKKSEYAPSALALTSIIFSFSLDVPEIIHAPDHLQKECRCFYHYNLQLN